MVKKQHSVSTDVRCVDADFRPELFKGHADPTKHNRNAHPIKIASQRGTPQAAVAGQGLGLCAGVLVAGWRCGF